MRKKFSFDENVLEVTMPISKKLFESHNFLGGCSICCIVLFNATTIRIFQHGFNSEHQGCIYKPIKLFCYADIWFYV